MSVRSIEAEVYIQSGVEAEVEIGREIVKTVYEEPVLESLEVVANGTYEPEEGVDGYSDVTVNVPGKIPVLESLDVIANGSYFPEEGVDGFNEVLVNVPTDPEKMVASGSFIAASTGMAKTIDTGRTDWTHMLIVPHVFPYVGLTASGLVRAIMSKHVDLENNVMITAYASSSGSSYTSSSSRPVQEGGDCEVSDGVVKFSGDGASVGKWIKNCQYDWWAWTDTPIEPEEPKVLQGRFTPTEPGIFTINTGYTGDGYPKSIIVCYLDDLWGSDFLEMAKRYAVSYFQARRLTNVEPTYSGETSENAYRYDLTYRYTLTSYYTISPATIYITDGEDPGHGGKNCVKMPNKNTLKVFVEDDAGPSGNAAFFQTGFEYFYQIIY